MKYVLALDQALNQSGWALFDADTQELKEVGILTPERGYKEDRRFVSVRKQWYDLINKYKPTKIVLEPPYGDDFKDDARAATTFSILNGTYWMLKEIAAEFNIETVDMPAATWQNRVGIFKRDRVSRKSGAKQFALQQNLSLLKDGLEQDIYDAYCIGYAYFYSLQFQNKKEEQIERKIAYIAFD